MVQRGRDRLYRFGMVLVRAMFGILGVKRTVTGVDEVPDAGGAVLAMTHFGYLEFALVAASIWDARRRAIRFLATSTVFEKPVIGAILRSAGQIPVDLHRGADAYEHAIAALRAGELVGVFPEAGVDASFTVRELKTGAVRLAQQAGVPLVPVVVWGGQRLATKKRRIRFFERFGVPVTIAIGTPLTIGSAGDPHVATTDLRARLQELLASAQATYPDADAGAWWQPRHLGGSARTPDEAVALDRELDAARDTRRAKRRGR